MTRTPTASAARPPAFLPPEESPQDPRRWWLPMGVVIACVLAAFWAGGALRDLTRTVNAIRDDMVTVNQFDRWSYQTEKLNNDPTTPWRAADLPAPR